jgi:hypothetical protein
LIAYSKRNTNFCASKRKHPKGTKMKIKILATIAVAASLAIAANGQGAGGAGGAGGSGAGAGGTAGAGTSGTSGSVGGAPATSGGGINSGVNGVTVNGSIVTPANPNPGVQLPPPVNPNTPIVGQGMGANNMTLGSNNLAMGTNAVGLGSNQFALRTNGLGTNFLAPTGPNGSRILSNNIPVNPPAATNSILLRP